MEQVGRWALLAVAAGLIVQTARPHYRYGAWLDATATIELAGLLIPFGMGAIMVLLHVAKAMMLALAAWFWRRAHYVCSVLAVLLFLLLLPVSVTSTFGFLDLQRGARAASEASMRKREADLRAELATVQEWLKDGGWRRPAALIEAEIAAERRNPFWAISSECRDATTRPQQRYCQALDRLAGELPGAKEAEDYRRRAKAIYSELQIAKPTAASSHPDLEFLSRTLSVSIEQAGLWRTVLFSAAIEAAEALLLLFGSAPGQGSRQARVPRRRIVSSLVSKYRKQGWWVTRKLVLPADNVPAPASVPEAMPAAEPHDIPKTSAAGEQGKAAKRIPPQKHACPRSRLAIAGARRSVFEPAASRPEGAVAAFVAELPKAPDGRVRGSAMFAAYEERRQTYGWPYLSAAQFGRHLKLAVESVGGRKVKANCQMYVGVVLQPA